MRDFPNNFDEILDRYPQRLHNSSKKPQKAANKQAEKEESPFN
jgi:hypothetical protein